MRSRSLTELELESTAGANGGANSRGGGKPRNSRENHHHHEHEASREEEGSSGDGGEAAPTTRKPRSVSNVDALFSSSTGGSGGGIENGSPPRHTMCVALHVYCCFLVSCASGTSGTAWRGLTRCLVRDGTEGVSCHRERRPGIATGTVGCDIRVCLVSVCGSFETLKSGMEHRTTTTFAPKGPEMPMAMAETVTAMITRCFPDNEWSRASAYVRRV